MVDYLVVAAMLSNLAVAMMLTATAAVYAITWLDSLEMREISYLTIASACGLAIVVLNGSMAIRFALTL